jgi:hypothetical protein
VTGAFVFVLFLLTAAYGLDVFFFCCINRIVIIIMSLPSMHEDEETLAWSPPSKEPESYHPLCQAYFYRPIDRGLLSDMLCELNGLRRRLGSEEDVRFYRKLEMDMENALKRQIKDLEECIAYADAFIV